MVCTHFEVAPIAPSSLGHDLCADCHSHQLGNAERSLYSQPAPDLKSLTSNLRHEYGPDCDVISERACINLPEVTAALAPLKGTLETLTLGAE